MMLQPRNEAAPQKVRLPRQDRLPDSARLKQALSCATEQKGVEVDASWYDVPAGKIFSLVVKFEPGKAQPTWFLWADNGEATDLLWNYETTEIELVNDLLLMNNTPNAPSTQAVQAPQSDHSEPSPPNFPQSLPAQHLPGASLPEVLASNPAEPAQSGAEAGLALKQLIDVQPKQNVFEDSPAGHAAKRLADAGQELTGNCLNGLTALSANVIGGRLEFASCALLLRTIETTQQSGKLEVVGSDSVGTIYFNAGLAYHATTSANSGDQAAIEMIAWRKGAFQFVLDERTAITSVAQSLDENISEGTALLDKKKHLESAGLTHESYLVKKQKQLSDGELKVYLLKGSDVDLETQIEIYRKIGARCTLANLLRDRPMEGALWTRVLYNFLTCGLIEIKAPDAMAHGALDFLGESKASVHSVANSFVRRETGILTYEALLYFLQYEFFRYEAYSWPVTLAIFDLSKRSRELAQGLDLIDKQEAAIALKRIELIKRPLDMLGHFEALHYALLLPNTKASAGAYVANRMLQALTATPISTGLDKRNLQVSFGIASIPSDATDLEALITSGKNALTKAIQGDFPIVVAQGPR